MKCTDLRFQIADLVLPSSFRKLFRRPFGVILSGDVREVTERVVCFVRNYNPLKFICVGDMIFRELFLQGFIPDLSIIDFKVSRRDVNFTFDRDSFDGVFRISNPAGHITSGAWITIQYLLSLNGKFLVEVDGEEDLLALPAVLCAPIGSIVSFGLPGEGVMLVPVNIISRREAFRLLSLLRPSRLD